MQNSVELIQDAGHTFVTRCPDCGVVVPISFLEHGLICQLCYRRLQENLVMANRQLYRHRFEYETSAQAEQARQRAQTVLQELDKGTYVLDENLFVLTSAPLTNIGKVLLLRQLNPYNLSVNTVVKEKNPMFGEPLVRFIELGPAGSNGLAIKPYLDRMTEIQAIADDDTLDEEHKLLRLFEYQLSHGWHYSDDARSGDLFSGPILSKSADFSPVKWFDNYYAIKSTAGTIAASEEGITFWYYNDKE